MEFGRIAEMEYEYSFDPHYEDYEDEVEEFEDEEDRLSYLADMEHDSGDTE